MSEKMMQTADKNSRKSVPACRPMNLENAPKEGINNMLSTVHRRAELQWAPPIKDLKTNSVAKTTSDSFNKPVSQAASTTELIFIIRKNSNSRLNIMTSSFSLSRFSLFFMYDAIMWLMPIII